MVMYFFDENHFYYTSIQGFTELDHEKAKAALGSSILKDLDNDYVRLVRELKPPPDLGDGLNGEDDDGEIDLCWF